VDESKVLLRTSNIVVSWMLSLGWFPFNILLSSSSFCFFFKKIWACMATWVDYFVTICISGIPFSFLTSTRPFYKKSMLEKITEIYNWNYINIMIKECIRCSMSHFLACVAIFCLLYVVILYCYLHLCQNVEMWVSAKGLKKMYYKYKFVKRMWVK
jgi:hypothetical protein